MGVAFDFNLDFGFVFDLVVRMLSRLIVFSDNKSSSTPLAEADADDDARVEVRVRAGVRVRVYEGGVLWRGVG